MMRLLIPVAAGLLLAGCGTGTGSDLSGGQRPGGPVSPPTAVPAAAGEVETRGAVLVLDDGDGAELCVGGVAESYPPQCGGPPITNWDWGDHHGDFEDAGGVRFGEFHLVGTFDGERFTASEVTPAAEHDAPAGPGQERLGTPCDDPQVVDPDRTSMTDFEAASAASRGLDGYGTTWVDTSREERTPAETDRDAAEGEADVSTWVLNVSVTRDLDGAEATLREHWGGRLCVSEAPYTEAELGRIQEELTEVPGMTGSGSEATFVRLGVVHDDGSIQAWADERYGAGQVRVSSALVPASG